MSEPVKLMIGAHLKCCHANSDSVTIVAFVKKKIKKDTYLHDVKAFYLKISQFNNSVINVKKENCFSLGKMNTVSVASTIFVLISNTEVEGVAFIYTSVVCATFSNV